MQAEILKVCRYLRRNPLVLAVVVLAGAGLRIREIFDPLWFDEAWVANSLMSGSLSDALYYQRVPQSTPPGWLALHYVLVRLVEPGDMAVRLISLLSGIGAIVMAAALGGRALGRSYRLPAAAVTAASSFMIIQSGQLKQYATDSLLAIWLLWGLMVCVTTKDARRWTALSVLYGISFAFAYTQMLLMPVVAMAMWLSVRRGELTAKAAAAQLTALAGVAAALWAVFVRPNTHPFLKIYWADQFPQSVAGAPEFYLLKLLQWTRVIQRSSRFEEAAWVIMLAITLIGVFSLVRRGGGDGRKALAAAGFGLTLAVLVCTSALRLYPMGPARLLLFSFPLLLMAWLAGVERIARAAGGLLGNRSARTMMRVWPAALALGAMAYMGRDLAGKPRGRPELSDAPGFTRLLREQSRPGDVIWLHGSAVDLAEYYFRKSGYPQGQMIRSGYGLPCCVTERLTVAGVSYADEVQREWDTSVEGRALRNVWLVTLEGELILNGFDDGARLRETLVDRGCRAVAKLEYSNARVDHLDCSGK
ncbi:MAG: glycosyltransferase family 39 protein [Bryobacteraceae bacterium]|nr:glycosyltransferase family 39 protein [Bryobacteraceae bacterium]